MAEGRPINQLQFSHQIFLLGIALRVWLTLSLNSSYLHPEESDSQSQLESDVLGSWSSHDRVRSTIWPLLTNGLPLAISTALFGPDVAQKPEIQLCGVRLVMLGLSFLTDMSVYRTCQRLGLDSFAVLATLASSCAMVVFHTRPLHGAVDTCLVAMLLYALADVVVRTSNLRYAAVQHHQRLQQLRRHRNNKALRNNADKTVQSTERKLSTDSDTAPTGDEPERSKGDAHGTDRRAEVDDGAGTMTGVASNAEIQADVIEQRQDACVASQPRLTGLQLEPTAIDSSAVADESLPTQNDADNAEHVEVVPSAQTTQDTQQLSPRDNADKEDSASRSYNTTDLLKHISGTTTSQPARRPVSTATQAIQQPKRAAVLSSRPDAAVHKRSGPTTRSRGRMLTPRRLAPYPFAELWRRLTRACKRLALVWLLLLFNNVIAALVTVPVLVTAVHCVTNLLHYYPRHQHLVHRLRRRLIFVTTAIFIVFVVFDTVITNSSKLQQGQVFYYLVVTPLYGLRRLRWYGAQTAPNRHGGVNFLLYLTLLLGSYAWRLMDVSLRGVLDGSKAHKQYMLQMIYPVGSPRRPVSAASLVTFLTPICRGWLLAVGLMAMSGHDVAVWDLSCLVVPACIIFGYRTFGLHASQVNAAIWILLNLMMIGYFGCLHQSGITPALSLVHRQLTYYDTNTNLRVNAAYIGVPSARPYLPQAEDIACSATKVFDLPPYLDHDAAVAALRNITRPVLVDCPGTTPSSLVLFTVAEARLHLRPSELPGKSAVAKVIWPHFNPSAPPRLAHITSFWEWSLVVYKSVIPVVRLQNNFCLVPDGGCAAPA
eukprot:TRINITY_DN7207_c0_g1_i1.p1 TRINITY_DN7207_c0_g1~~TRINITY_DN7207_c0_g1_i1.p1  ORF type:complete len:824 (+),score=141.64 TRINITY_DN7207_c0_g1_i1:123-2594(+)